MSQPTTAERFELTPRLALIAAATAALAWAAVTFAPQALGVALALVALGAGAALAWREPQYALAGLVAAAALDVNGRLAAIGPFKVTVYQALLVAVIALAAWRVRTGASRLRATPIDLPAIAFIAIAAISVLAAPQTGRAITAIVSLTSSIVLAYLVVVLADSPSRLRDLVVAVVTLGALFGVLAVLERYEVFSVMEPLRAWGYGIKPRVTFEDPNTLGHFLAVAAGLGVPLAAIWRGWRQAAIAAAVLAMSAGVWFTGSRGSLAALLIAIAVGMLAVRIPTWQKLVVVGAAAAAVVAGIAFFLDPLVLQRKILGVATDPSALARVDMAASAWQMIADNPFGVGAANYPVVYPFYRDAAVRSSLVESHTMLLTVLVEYGWAGLIAFTVLLWRWLSRTALAALRARDALSQALAAGALGAGVAAVAQSFTYSLETSKFLWLTVGIGLSVYACVQSISEEESA